MNEIGEVNKLLRLARNSLAKGLYSDDDGEYASVIDTNYRGSDWYHRVIIRPQRDGAYLLEMFSHFEHNAADIPIWGNADWREMPKPRWEMTKIASVRVMTIGKCTREEKEQIAELFRYANGPFWSALNDGISGLRPICS